MNTAKKRNGEKSARNTSAYTNRCALNIAKNPLTKETKKDTMLKPTDSKIKEAT